MSPLQTAFIIDKHLFAHFFFSLQLSVCCTAAFSGFYLFQSSRCLLEETVTHGCALADYSLEILHLLCLLIQRGERCTYTQTHASMYTSAQSCRWPLSAGQIKAAKVNTSSFDGFRNKKDMENISKYDWGREALICFVLFLCIYFVLLLRFNTLWLLFVIC